MAHDPILHLLGLAKKAGRLEIGEEPVGAACPGPPGPRAPAGRRTPPPTRCRRAAHFGEAGGALWLQMPFTKAELGEQLGRSSCAMLAVTDFGLRRRPGGEAGRSGRGAVRPRSSAAEGQGGPAP